MADLQFGGRITLQFAGQILVCEEASIKLTTTPQKAEAKANQDGSPAYIYTPQLYGADFTLRNDSSITWATYLMATGNATIVELDNGRTHLFTACRLVGDPSYDLVNGTVSGLSLRGGQYSVLTGQ